MTQHRVKVTLFSDFCQKYAQKKKGKTAQKVMIVKKNDLTVRRKVTKV